MNDTGCENCARHREERDHYRTQFLDLQALYQKLEAHHIKETKDLYETAKALKDPTRYPMTSICSVCGKNLGVKPGGTKPGLISHGVCKDQSCIEDFKNGIKRKMPWEKV